MIKQKEELIFRSGYAFGQLLGILLIVPLIPMVVFDAVNSTVLMYIIVLEALAVILAGHFLFHRVSIYSNFIEIFYPLKIVNKRRIHVPSDQIISVKYVDPPVRGVRAFWITYQVNVSKQRHRLRFQCLDLDDAAKVVRHYSSLNKHIEVTPKTLLSKRGIDI